MTRRPRSGRAEPSHALHVTPTDDLVDHQLDDDCVCGPRAERVVRADGTDGWVILHHSLDGRELVEPAVDPSDPTP